MAITYSEDGSVKKRKGDKKKSTIAMADFFGVPKDVRDANKRLSGPGPHDINDSKTVIDYYKKKRLSQRPKDMKDFEFESIQRQYSGKDYTIEDKKNVINYYKRQKKGKV